MSQYSIKYFHIIAFLSLYSLTAPNSLLILFSELPVKKVLGLSSLLCLISFIIIYSRTIILNKLFLIFFICFLVIMDVIAGALLSRLDANVLFILINNTLGMVSLLAIVSSSKNVSRIELDWLVSIVSKFLLFTFVTPLILIYFGIIAPEPRFIYYGTRYAGFAWELTTIGVVLVLYILLINNGKTGVKKIFILSSIILFVVHFKVISNAYILSVLFVTASMITCMTVKRLRMLVFLVSASVVQNWEILLLKFLDLFKMIPILKINSSNGRVMGRLEGAADFLSQNDMSVSIWMSYISLLDFGSSSFQHGYAHYNTSFLGIFLLTLMNFVIGRCIIFQNNVKQSVVLVFLYFCITALLGPNFALICLFAMLYCSFVSDNCAKYQGF